MFEHEPEVSLTVKKAESSIQSPAQSGFDCIVVLRLRTMRGILERICHSEEECRDSENVHDADLEDVLELFGLKTRGKITFKRLNYGMENLYWCGEPKVSVHRDIQKGKDSVANLL